MLGCDWFLNGFVGSFALLTFAFGEKYSVMITVTFIALLSGMTFGVL